MGGLNVCPVANVQEISMSAFETAHDGDANGTEQHKSGKSKIWPVRQTILSRKKNSSGLRDLLQTENH